MFSDTNETNVTPETTPAAPATEPVAAAPVVDTPAPVETPAAPPAAEPVKPVETAAPAEPAEHADAAGENDSFAAMFAEENQKSKAMKQGTKVLATIQSIDGETVFVDVGSKTDGFVEAAELRDEEGNLTCKPGDQVELYIVSVQESEIKLSRALQGQAGKWALRDAAKSGIPVQGRVKEVVKGGYSVIILGQRAFCPMSQMDVRFVEKPEEFVGKVLPFKITKYEGSGRRVDVVVSRLPLLRELERENLVKFEELVKENPVMKGRVTRLEPFGMFVELLPGIEGMCHVSECAWSRIDHPNRRFKSGDEVTVKVLDVKRREPKEAEEGGDEKKSRRRDRGEQLKISLSVKQMLPHPWEAFRAAFQKGTIVQGRVTKLMEFGAFVELTDGVEGLVHLSELSYEKRGTKPEELVKPGDEIAVKILEIDDEKRKVSLSLRQAGVDPWADAATRFPIGGRVSGTIEKKEKFGWFVKLGPGFTGLMPQSKLADAPNAKEFENLRPGDPISLVVIDLNPRDRKITLAPELSPEDDWKRFSHTAAKEAVPVAAATGEMSPLAEALLKKFKEKGLDSKGQ